MSGDEYEVLWATIDKTPYAHGESFRVGRLTGLWRRFKDAFATAKASADAQVRGEIAAITGSEPGKKEMDDARVRMVERPSDSTLLVKLAHGMTMYKIWKTQGGAK